MRSFRTRVLSREERDLWSRVTEYVARPHVSPDRSTRLARPASQRSEAKASGAATTVEATGTDDAISLRAEFGQLLEGPRPAKPVPVAITHPAAPGAMPVRRAPALAPIDGKLLKQVRRGRRGVDGVLDLHGLYQADARRALDRFVHERHAAGATIVIVITGKGTQRNDRTGIDTIERERGVLRRNVPHWLRAPELRPYILGFDEAAPGHGGGGALYVRLRRKPVT